MLNTYQKNISIYIYYLDEKIRINVTTQAVSSWSVKNFVRQHPSRKYNRQSLVKCYPEAGERFTYPKWTMTTYSSRHMYPSLMSTFPPKMNVFRKMIFLHIDVVHSLQANSLTQHNHQRQWLYCFNTRTCGWDNQRYFTSQHYRS